VLESLVGGVVGRFGKYKNRKIVVGCGVWVLGAENFLYTEMMTRGSCLRRYMGLCYVMYNRDLPKSLQRAKNPCNKRQVWRYHNSRVPASYRKK